MCPLAKQVYWTRALCTLPAKVPVLILGTDLRPADVLTSALGNAYTNTGSPHAVGAGLDCTQTMVEFTFGTRWPATPSLTMTKH